MEKFKTLWQITKNWQLLFPFLGIVGLVYSAYRIALIFIKEDSLFLMVSVTLFLSFLFLKVCLFFIKKLEGKWVVQQRWEMIRIFIVFAITGSSSAFIGRPIFRLMGISKENLNPFLYYLLFIVISLVFYQMLLVLFGWLFGQFRFFWEFEKKMLSRMGLGFLFKQKVG
jgi:hypothetical protein